MAVVFTVIKFMALIMRRARIASHLYCTAMGGDYFGLNEIFSGKCERNWEIVYSPRMCVLCAYMGCINRNEHQVCRKRHTSNEYHLAQRGCKIKEIKIVYGIWPGEHVAFVTN